MNNKHQRHDDEARFRASGLETLCQRQFSIGKHDEQHDDDNGVVVTVYGLGGSILDFEGKCPKKSAIVNAANSGGITGFGVDERINRAGGHQLKQARREFLGGIPTGTCKSTPAFDHSKKVGWIIHAVGPVLRDNSLAAASTTLDDKLQQLTQAYETSLIEATRLQCDEVAFCLLSCGVFRGNVALTTCIKQGLNGIQRFYYEKHHDPSLTKTTELEQFSPSTICLVAFTDEEQQALINVLQSFDFDR